jgi:hypothetical protein
MYQYGPGFLFVSAAFDDKASCFAVRLATPSSSNSSFPAKDSGLMDQMFNCKDVFQEKGTPFVLKIDEPALLKLIAESPVASVQFFKTFFEVCVGFINLFLMLNAILVSDIFIFATGIS